MSENAPHTTTLPPELAVFDKDVGTWDAEVEVRPSPDAPVQRSMGRAVNTLSCGGRWLVSEFKNATSGFQGHGVYGWDTAKQKYVGTWVDNMRTFLTVAEGEWDAATQTMTFRNEAHVGGRTFKWREVTQTKDRDTLLYRSIFPTPDGGEFEMMTVVYRRVKELR